MLDKLGQKAMQRTGLGLINFQWLVLKKVKAKLLRKDYGVKEVFALENFCKLWFQNMERMKTGKKDKWQDYDLKVLNLLLSKTGLLVLSMKARAEELDLSIIDDWQAYFDELEERYKSKNAVIDVEGIKAFMQTEEAQAGLEKWRALGKK